MYGFCNAFIRTCNRSPSTKERKKERLVFAIFYRRPQEVMALTMHVDRDNRKRIYGIHDLQTLFAIELTCAC